APRKTTPPPDLGRPGKEGSDSIAGDAKKVAGMNYTAIDILYRLELRHQVRCLAWDTDAKAFFHLDPSQGIVRRILLDGFKEERRQEIGARCSCLSMSAEGLLVTV